MPTEPFARFRAPVAAAPRPRPSAASSSGSPARSPALPRDPEAPVAVKITFQPPERAASSSSLPPLPATHQRRLGAVPARIARRMVDDWAEYCSLRARAATDSTAALSDAVEAVRQRLYRFSAGDDEKIVALDFHEILSVVISPS